MAQQLRNTGIDNSNAMLLMGINMHFDNMERLLTGIPLYVSHIEENFYYHELVQVVTLQTCTKV